MTRRERGRQIAAGAGVAAVASVLVGPTIGSAIGVLAMKDAIAGRQWVPTRSARARGAAPEARKAASSPSGRVTIPPANAAKLRAAYQRWLAETGEEDNDASATRFAEQVWAALQERRS